MQFDDFIQELALEYRDRAEAVREYARDERVASIWEAAADVLEGRFEKWALEAITLTEAAEETHYTRSALTKMVSRGDLEDVSDGGTCRVRRRDLPRKPTRPGNDAEPDLADLRLGGS